MEPGGVKVAGDAAGACQGFVATHLDPVLDAVAAGLRRRCAWNNGDSALLSSVYTPALRPSRGCMLDC